jgi:hypothetical protein
MRVSNPLLLTAVLLGALSGCDGNGLSTSTTSQTFSEEEGPGGIERRSAAAEFEEVEIIDQRGFGEPMIAARAQLPGDWQARGGIAWDRSTECVTNHLRMNWLAVSPDQREAIELMPGYNWQVQGTDIAMNPCPPLAIRTPQQFLEMIAQRYPNARVLGYRDRPDLVTQPAQTQGIRAENVAGELLIAYPTASGEVRERLSATLSISEMQGNIVIGAPMVMAHRVAGGEPDPAVSDRFIKSLKIAERQRQNIATWHNNQMARINARGAAERSQIRAQANREVAQIYSNIWSSSQATDERIQRRTLEGIGGYNSYADPDTGSVVRGSIEYERTLRLQNGDYVSTNDPYLNPAGSEELERIP